ncbi:hypothetical protein [Noviherbaspirillum autotrophicum]|uniref:Uncharacterized protein n=1 Tax=Noviherbaspirillum autotrophicum TaxID=709839 RepID=A0A0C2BLG7_9BURK|nr:hypothetical protein [Noviherbaspirillum autotrophicum]KIF82095.1 hypothetical protein TSA66_16875 [Noviherbaspirillum autotrophicum]
MSVLTSTQPVFGDHYFSNVGKAALALLSALVSVKPRRRRVSDADELTSLCRRYEGLTPNLANELRFMASRG